MGTQKLQKIILGAPWDALWAHFAAESPPGPHFGRFFVDFGSHFGCLWGDLLHIFSHLFPASFPSRVLDGILA